MKSTDFEVDPQAWVNQQRSLVAGRVRALQSVRLAAGWFANIHSNLSLDSDDSLSARFLAAVVQYARPFVPSKRKDRGKFTQPIKELKDWPGFDRELHEHILFLRNTIVAHDDDIVASWMFHAETTKFRVGEHPVEITIGVGALASMPMGIADHALAKQYADHSTATAEALEGLVSFHLRDILQHTLLRPDLVINGAEAGSDTPVSALGSDKWGVHIPAPARGMPAANLQRDGYRSQDFGRGERLLGEVTIPVPGNTLTITITPRNQG